MSCSFIVQTPHSNCSVNYFLSVWAALSCAISLGSAISADVWVCVGAADTHRPQLIRVLTMRKIVKTHTQNSVDVFREITLTVLVNIGSLSGGQGGEICKIYLRLTVSVYCEMN